MTTADGPGQLVFTDWAEECTAGRRSKGACRCSACASPVAARALSGRSRRTARHRYGIGLAAVLMTGAGAIGLGSGSANAEPAPSHRGWDGSVYWFMNSAGHWRWTSHEDVYLSRIGASGAGAATGPSSNGGLSQGWDGSVYWFMNSAGHWRWTSHEDVYLSRIGASGAGAATGPSSNGDPAASDGSTGSNEAAVEFALAQLGKPFVTAGNGPDGYDCSGLVQQAYRNAGVSLPRVANDQYAATTPISADQLRRGDLLFWSDSGSAEGIHHVAIYLGGNQYVEAAHPGTDIRISTLSDSYYPTHLGRP